MQVELVECSKDEDPFLYNLGLLTIWNEENTVLVIDSYRFWQEGNDTGTFYKIVSDGCVVGITGYWIINETDAGLRWHGVIPLFQNCNVGSTALKLLIEKLPPNIVNLHEITLSHKPVSFFKDNGFKENLDGEAISEILLSSGSFNSYTVLTYQKE